MANPYESKRYLDEYLLFHYGGPDDLCPFPFVPRELFNFHERILKECLLPIRGKGRTSALDAGCAVGRLSFELSKVVDEVVGLDNSKHFIEAARRMGKEGAVVVKIHESGPEFTKRRLVLPKGVRRAGVKFQAGDAQELGAFAREGFEVVAAINLLCRLPSPLAFLRQLPGLVSPGGQLVIASPFSWLDEYTLRRRWLSPEALESFLRPDFQLVRRKDLPFVIREHRRKYQLVVSRVLTFRRRG